MFEVQPDAKGSFSTIQKYNDCSYEFKLVNNIVIITERKADVFEKELIDQSSFDEEFPFHLANDYSHWWNEREHCIEFRQKPSGRNHFSLETTVVYRLNLLNGRLIHVQSQLPMLDIKSQSYKLITKQLSRLEHRKYIHVMYKADSGEAQIELSRMNLKFTIKYFEELQKNYMLSNEFNGMRVSRTQKIGTLYGLNHGLLLESFNKDGKSDEHARKILLVPNGQVVMKSGHSFPSVFIDTKSELQTPRFYQYQVDKFCQQLKSTNGSHASWFYLAYLHAVTSHGEIEPFTGMSGTERAVQILQSAFAWSSSPYDAEAIRMLGKIAELTPHRKLANNMQTVNWPKSIPPRSAQDCFVFITRKLLTDSLRLRSFHGECSDKKIDFITSLKLNERSHRHGQQLNPNLIVTESFIEHKELITSQPSRVAVPLCDNTRTVCILYHNQQFKIPRNRTLKEFLIGENDRTLDGWGNIEDIGDLLNHSVQSKFRDIWISLYEAIIRRLLNPEQLAIVLSFYAHIQQDIQPILALQAIAANRSKFQHIMPPPYKTFQVSDDVFKSNRLHDILIQHYKQPDKYHSEWDTRKQQSHDTRFTAILDDIIADIIHNWPCPSFDFAKRWTFKYIDFIAANEAVNEKLRVWYANYKLNQFIEDVEKQLSSLVSSGVSRVKVESCPVAPFEPKNWAKTSIDYDEKLHEISRPFEEEIKFAHDIWTMETNEHNYSVQQWWKIYKKMYSSGATLHLVQAGLFPRMVPSLLLPKIMEPQFDHDLKCLIGAYAMSIACEQREDRIHELSKRPELKATFDKERLNEPYENWSPHEYPEWLLFEIEQNLTIRRIQIEIAKRMIQPPENETKHSVMQLNMGEGKTAVIVPILAARLADGKQACQVIVLKSLFATNLKSLRQYLGGFLNRRIYIFPCRRDMPIESHAHEILNIYQECKQEKG